VPMPVSSHIQGLFCRQPTKTVAQRFKMNERRLAAAGLSEAKEAPVGQPAPISVRTSSAAAMVTSISFSMWAAETKFASN